MWEIASGGGGSDFDVAMMTSRGTRGWWDQVAWGVWLIVDDARAGGWSWEAVMTTSLVVDHLRRRRRRMDDGDDARE